MIILSILISTTPDRAEMFTPLYNELHHQLQYMETFHPTLGHIEILVDDSKLFLEGGLSIGKKREALLKRAEGKYLCYLDSDDGIAPNYLETLVRLCQHDRDVCTFRNVSKFDNFWTVIDMGLFFKNEEATPNHTTRRNAWHICPVRSMFAKKYDFDDSNYGEDWSWFKKVLTHCNSEAKSEAIIHEYNHSVNHSEADKIMRYVQPIK